ncbi:MAG: TonB-dependent receptor plug domain-containing protein [Bacteroidales bacterium]
MKNCKKILFSTGLWIVTSWYSIQAQDTIAPAGSILDLSLEEILNISVKSGNIKQLSIRETPGILTVYTADDLSEMGVTDLMEVLQLVPGVEFGSDIMTSVGLGMRGLWASEGKISLFIDEFEMNDLGYGSIPWGNHFPTDQIEKIEIIRGPGSSIFGGTSQYGVIRIITRAGSLNGIRVNNVTGHMGEQFNFRSDNLLQRRNLNIQAGHAGGQGHWYLSANLGNSQRSDREFEDYSTGQKISFEGRSDINAQSLILSGSYKNLKGGFLADNYSNQGPDYYGSVYDIPLTTRYKSLAGYAAWNWNPTESFTLETAMKFRNQNPWYSMDSISWISYDSTKTTYVGDRELNRFTIKLDAVYDPGKYLSILVGSEIDMDKGRVLVDEAPGRIYSLMANGKTSASYRNLSNYLQATLKSRLVNLTLGGRMEMHSLGYKSFVPRFGITRAFSRLHLKLMASQSFRNPAMLDLKVHSINPEKATIFEFETGYQFTQRFFMDVNFFDITVDKMIYYFNDPVSGEGGYNNSPEKSGSRGVEMEARMIFPRVSLQASYSFYTADGKNNIPTFSADPDLTLAGTKSDRTSYFLGFAKHKVSINSNMRLSNNISFNLNGVLSSKRYGWISASEGISSFDPMYLINTSLRIQNIFRQKADLTAGIYNLLDSDYRYITPYNAGHAAIPSEGREYRIGLLLRL